MNKVERKILPVGQGAFYLETLYKDGQQYKIVYDCGSATDVDKVRKQIKRNFKKGDLIHAVFISHLDDDHVNGLEYLLDYCKVKHLFFPLITDETKEFNEFRNLVNPQSDFVNQFIDSKGRSIQERFQERETILTILHPIQISEDGNNEQLIEETSEAIFSKGKSDWIYLPHNFREESRYDKLKKGLKDIDSQLSQSIFNNEGNIDLDSLKKLWKNVSDKKLIKSTYRKVPGGLNVNSMTLYSGYRNNHYSYCDYYSYCCDRCFFGFHGRICIKDNWFNLMYLKKNGCLYTGDYDAGRSTRAQKWQSLKRVYGEYFQNVGLVQVPHHGSRKNYNRGFRDREQINSAVYFVSAGQKNPYHHPHKEVVIDLISDGKILNVVTEDDNSSMAYYSYWR